MDEPTWIRKDVVLAIQQRQLAEHGGEKGLRDDHLLESALARPRNLWAYSNPKPHMAALAASLAFGIVRNHPFVDGNKRTAFVVCRLFLRLNGFDLAASQEAKYFAFLNLAAGEVNEESLSDWLSLHLSSSP